MCCSVTANSYRIEYSHCLRPHNSDRPLPDGQACVTTNCRRRRRADRERFRPTNARESTRRFMWKKMTGEGRDVTPAVISAQIACANCTSKARRYENDSLDVWCCRLLTRSPRIWVVVVITPPPISVRSIVMTVSVCLFVCLPASITPKLHATRPISAKHFLRVAYVPDSVLLWRRCDRLCISGFMNDVMSYILARNRRRS